MRVLRDYMRNVVMNEWMDGCIGKSERYSTLIVLALAKRRFRVKTNE